MKKLSFISIILISLLACQSPQEKINKQFKNSITQYIENIEEGFKVDSIKILNIDTLTDFSFAYMSKIVLENKQYEFRSHPLYETEPSTPEERVDKFELEELLDGIANELYKCDSILLDPATDSTTLKYYFVSTRIFGRDFRGTNQQLEIGFPITPEFKIQEIQMGNSTE